MKPVISIDQAIEQDSGIFSTQLRSTGGARNICANVGLISIYNLNLSGSLSEFRSMNAAEDLETRDLCDSEGGGASTLRKSTS